MLIVIEPCFAEGHILEAHIRNVCEYFSPDYFFILEGMFPTGPEDTLRGGHGAAFRQKYTLDGTRSFDLQLMRDIVKRCQSDYPNVKIEWIEANYEDYWNNAITWHHVYMYPSTVLDLKPDDMILTLETDLLFTKSDASTILSELESLRPGGNFGLLANEIFLAPYMLMGRRDRKCGFKWGTGKEYDNLFRVGVSNTEYPKHVQKWLQCGWHYAWMRPDKYYEMRIEQIPKTNINVLHSFKGVLNSRSPNMEERLREIYQILLPRQTLGYVEENLHPLHIRNHPNFDYYG